MTKNTRGQYVATIGTARYYVKHEGHATGWTVRNNRQVMVGCRFKTREAAINHATVCEARRLDTEATE